MTLWIYTSCHLIFEAPRPFKNHIKDQDDWKQNKIATTQAESMKNVRDRRNNRQCLSDAAFIDKLANDIYQENLQKELARYKQLNETLRNYMKDIKTVRNRYYQENLKLKLQIKDLNAKLDLASNLGSFDLKQLNEIEYELQSNVMKVQEAKKRLLFCVVCSNNHRTIAIDRCGHFVLCDDCAQELSPKKCPLCKIRFKKYSKLKF